MESARSATSTSRTEALTVIVVGAASAPAGMRSENARPKVIVPPAGPMLALADTTGTSTAPAGTRRAMSKDGGPASAPASRGTSVASRTSAATGTSALVGTSGATGASSVEGTSRTSTDAASVAASVVASVVASVAGPASAAVPTSGVDGASKPASAPAVPVSEGTTTSVAASPMDPASDAGVDDPEQAPSIAATTKPTDREAVWTLIGHPCHIPRSPSNGGVGTQLRCCTCGAPPARMQQRNCVPAAPLTPLPAAARRPRVDERASPSGSPAPAPPRAPADAARERWSPRWAAAAPRSPRTPPRGSP